MSRLGALYTTREVAKYLRVSARTVWALVASGRIRSFRPSPRRVLIDEADLLAYVRRCKARGYARRRRPARRRPALP